MTNEQKQLLIKDLCARLPYGVKCADFKYDNNGNKIDIVAVLGIINPDYQNYSCLGNLDITHEINRIKPYLRPLSSMTEEERKEFDKVLKSCNNKVFACPEKERRYNFFDAEQEDFMNAHHFDYRGLIPMGLALEAPKDMYK